MHKKIRIILIAGCFLGAFPLGCLVDQANLEDTPPSFNTTSEPIINGTACDAVTQSASVAIIIDGKMEIYGWPLPLRTVLCTGTLIAPDVVLTAAHCLRPDLLLGGYGTVKDVKYYISFTSDLSDLADMQKMMTGQLAPFPPDAVPVSSETANPGFKPELLTTMPNGPDNWKDIGLMFLAQPVYSVEPAVVITKEEATQLSQGASVEISGWGQQTPDQNTSPVGAKFCATTTINELGDFEMQIGGGYTTGRKCHGDSGGPTFINVTTTANNKTRVIGVTSHAYDQTDCAKGGLDTRVDVWYDWLDAQMKGACQQSMRQWCDVEGIIPPDYVYGPPPGEPVPDLGPPQPEAGSANISEAGLPLVDGGSSATGDGLSTDGGGTTSSEDDGCGCVLSERQNPFSAIVLLSLLILVLMRRRRRSSYSAARRYR